MCSSSKFHLEHQNIQWAIYEANYHPCLPLCPLNPQPYWVREQHLQTKSSMEEGASLNPQPTTFTWWYLAPSLSSTVWGNVYPVEFEFEAHTGYEFEAHRELHLRHTELDLDTPSKPNPILVRGTWRAWSEQQWWVGKKQKTLKSMLFISELRSNGNHRQQKRRISHNSRVLLLPSIGDNLIPHGFYNPNNQGSDSTI